MLFLASYAAAQQPQPGTASLADRLTRAFDAAIPSALEAENIPGAVIAVGRRVRSGSARAHRFETWQKAYGDLGVEPQREPMPENAIFDLASLTKPIATGTSLMILIERGKLSLDDPVKKHLPDFADANDPPVTVRQLMLHASGMPAYLDKSTQDELRRSAGFPCANATRRRVVAQAPGAPGTLRYSCLNAILCERLIDAITGQPLDSFAAANIFEPLRMDETGFRPAAGLRGRIAPTTRAPHGAGDGGFLRGQVHDPLAALQDGVSGNAGLFGTAADLSRYCRMLLSDGTLDGARVLKAETIREMTLAQTPTTQPASRPVARGLLWEIYPAIDGASGIDAASAFGHTGFTGTAIRVYPTTGVYIIALTNRVHPDEKGGIAGFRKLVWRIVGEEVVPGQ